MLISVVMITYKHERFIREAIEGVLLQKGEFDIELIIANDNSPDKTDQIISQIINTHSRGEIIQYYNHNENIGMINNFLFALQLPKGKYVALCEGDDYWTDPMKLKKQVDFLEQNKEFSFCCHAVDVKNEIPGYTYSYPVPDKNKLLFPDVVKRHYIATCSVMYRAEMLPNPLPKFIKYSLMGDLPLELILADKGPVYYFNEPMAVYRKNKSGITRDKVQIRRGRQGYIYLYKRLLLHFFPSQFLILTFILIKTYLGYIKDKFR